jgi:hypothetical protein
MVEIVDVCEDGKYQNAKKDSLAQSGTGYFFNTRTSSNNTYFLPAMFSITTAACNTTSFTTNSTAKSLPLSQQFECGDPIGWINSDICEAKGCFWDTTIRPWGAGMDLFLQSPCYYSNSAVIPSTCPFIPPSNRISCPKDATSASACNQAGCCWNDGIVGMSLPRCYRSDIFKSSNTNFTDVSLTQNSITTIFIL